MRKWLAVVTMGVGIVGALMTGLMLSPDLFLVVCSESSAKFCPRPHLQWR